MLIETDSLPMSGTVVDLPSLSLNFPAALHNEVMRDNVVNTITNLLQENVHAAAIEGPEGIGKTTVIAQFARKHSSNAISLFVSAANRLSYDPDLIKSDIAGQVYWAVTGEVLNRAKYDPALLKTYFGQLQHRAKQRKQFIYFVVDGLDELSDSVRNNLIQHLADILPIGIPQFRFLFAGEDVQFKDLIKGKLTIKSFPLTEFGIEETRNLFSGHVFDLETLTEINGLCRGIPARLAGVGRALDRGAASSDFVREAHTKWPEFFETDWKQVDSKDIELNRILALLAHDSKVYTPSDVAEILSMSESAVRSQLIKVNFILIDGQSQVISFATSGLRRYAADQLKSRKHSIQKLLIKRLLTLPQSDESVLELPGYMEDAAEYVDLLNLLTPEHILQVLERTQTLSKVDDTVIRGFRTAKKLNRDADLLRFGLQQSIIADLATVDLWESEVAALASLNRDIQALALANSAVLREDRLQMLSTLAHHIWLRGNEVPSEHLEQIKLLINNIDPGALGPRAEKIASQLTCISPDMALHLIKRTEHGTDDESVGRTFVRYTVSALSDLKSDQRRTEAIESAVRSREHSPGHAILEGVRVLTGKFTPEEVCKRAAEILRTDARLLVLRYWCALNGTDKGANSVAVYALNLAVATPSSRLDADILNDLAKAIVGGPDVESKKELIGVLDGLQATAERLGPSVGFVRLQLTIAMSEADFEPQAAEGRLLKLAAYIAAIKDLPSRGQAYALLLGVIRILSDKIQLQSGDSLEATCSSELEYVVLVLSESTADHYLALGGMISGLASGDIDKALEYNKMVNTEDRRNLVLLDILKVLLTKPPAGIEPKSIMRVIVAISGDDRDSALYLALTRLSEFANLSSEQVEDVIPIIDELHAIGDSICACSSLVCALKLLHAHSNPDRIARIEGLKNQLRERWNHIDIGWLKVDAGYGIARDLASFSLPDAEDMLSETDALKSEWRIAVQPGASTYISSIRVSIRALCGLLPRRLETPADIEALAALIEILPSYGERAILWADFSMRAALAGRSDLVESIVSIRLQPAFSKISVYDKHYRSSVLITIAPAWHRAQPVSCLEEVSSLDSDGRDLALLYIVRFLLWNRVPYDPIEKRLRVHGDVTYENLLQIESLTNRMTTDWMIFSIAEDIADGISSQQKKHILTLPQSEDISRRFTELANKKLPSNRHITHHGYLIATLAQALKMRQAKKSEWITLIQKVNDVSNVSDRVYVRQIIALSLPKNMDSDRALLLEQSGRDILEIPWDLDQIERILGLAEDLHGVDTPRCRDLVNRAASAIATSHGDVKEQRTRLVDLAYRIDEDLAEHLIDEFDDDKAKRRAKSQVNLLEVRKHINDQDNRANQQSSIARVKGNEVHKLGVMLLKARSAEKIQNFRPSDVREYLDLAAQQPLKRALPLIMWYVQNAIDRYAHTDQAASFLRPICDASILGTQLAGQISGKSLIRLKASKSNSNELSSHRSLLVKPGTREDAIRVVQRWLDSRVGDEVMLHDPYFGPQDISWVQLIRAAKPECTITVLTSRKHQPTLAAGIDLETIYVDAWRGAYDQAPPKAEIAIIGGESSKESPIHDRWLVSNGTGLRFGTSLNSLGISKESEISEMLPEDAEQKRNEILLYLNREKTEHRAEKLRLTRFWL